MNAHYNQKIRDVRLRNILVQCNQQDYLLLALNYTLTGPGWMTEFIFMLHIGGPGLCGKGVQ